MSTLKKKGQPSIWVLSICAFLLLLKGGESQGASQSLCFDFSKRVTEPLVPVPRGGIRTRDVSKSGKLSQGKVWGSAHGRVKASSAVLYERLLDHYVVKDPKKVKLKVYDREWPGYDDFHMVMVTAKPGGFTVDWEEDWAYAITKGTREAPERVVVSYQKVEGTPYLAHLCGSIVLTKVKDGETDVFLYEEIQAFGRRSPKETAQGHLGTLKGLRRP